MDTKVRILSAQTGRAFDADWAGRMKRTAIRPWGTGCIGVGGGTP